MRWRGRLLTRRDAKPAKASLALRQANALIRRFPKTGRRPPLRELRVPSRDGILPARCNGSETVTCLSPDYPPLVTEFGDSALISRSRRNPVRRDRPAQSSLISTLSPNSEPLSLRSRRPALRPRGFASMRETPRRGRALDIAGILVRTKHTKGTKEPASPPIGGEPHFRISQGLRPLLFVPFVCFVRTRCGRPALTGAGRQAPAAAPGPARPSPASRRGRTGSWGRRSARASRDGLPPSGGGR